MGGLARFMRAVDDRLAGVERLIAIACLIVIVVVTGLGVFFRYVLADPLIWSNDAGIVSLMWLTFIGGSLLFKTNDHISIAAVPSLLPRRPRLILNTLFVALIGIAVLTVAWQMLTLLPLQATKQIEALSLPRSAYGIPLMWAMISIAWSAVAKILAAATGTAVEPAAGMAKGL